MPAAAAREDAEEKGNAGICAFKHLHVRTIRGGQREHLSSTLILFLNLIFDALISTY